MIRSARRSRHASFALALVVLTALMGEGCGRRPAATDRPYAVPVDVFADTGRAEPLRVVPPAVPAARAEVWLAHVSPARPTSLELPAPEATTDTLTVPLPAPPALAVDDGLKPPIPRTRAPLRVPAGARGFVELDVQVDDQGRVASALRAGGSADTSLVRAATACALEMSFYPAL